MKVKDMKKIMSVPFWINIAIIFVLIIKIVFLIVFHRLVFWFELVSDIGMCALGVVLILFYRKGKNKSICLANGIIAIIPFLNFTSLILSLMWLIIRDSKDIKDNIVSVANNIKETNENIKETQVINENNPK